MDTTTEPTIDLIPFVTKYRILIDIVVIIVICVIIAFYVFFAKLRLNNPAKTLKQLSFCKPKAELKFRHIVFNDLVVILIVGGILGAFIWICESISGPVLEQFFGIFIMWVCLPLFIICIIYAIFEPIYRWKKFNRQRIQSNRSPITFFTMFEDHCLGPLYSVDIHKFGFLYREIQSATYHYDSQKWTIEPKEGENTHENC